MRLSKNERLYWVATTGEWRTCDVPERLGRIEKHRTWLVKNDELEVKARKLIAEVAEPSNKQSIIVRQKPASVKPRRLMSRSFGRYGTGRLTAG